ncbi:hypothetical protein PSECIP111951_01347 [Pseudoalteromonas holothuriae]|uniref:Heparan-alpha-glucosaminide N-acetyltransferase catalytic domain-containing protein n=1 Tax=Pseudoalteromonas holothuriae TaxID=2963714 RepID=A0ABM9GGD0_9GAMM|nr:heparan-alpha-glucosaminide N-acetyltransferase domain-containing protein [Pseudoalteromonas sp. CIP111951]CAH9055923.1 hypothetical protein PSECIP111951_01347 [Pseudoalteromonas sp. CIP111951]
MSYASTQQLSSRLTSIDILRGLIIVLMALDHTRGFWGVTLFSPTDLEYTHWTWFFTRWITHFCAPLFVFLTGISAFLYGQKVQNKTKLCHFLLSRGVWLILLEVLVITPSWQGHYDTIILQVIWVIGWSMVLLSALIYLQPKWILTLTVPILLIHNAFNDIEMTQTLVNFEWLWTLLHSPGAINLYNNTLNIYVAYPLIPWFSVMALGYVLGQAYLWPQTIRIKYLTRLGLCFTMVFILLRASNIYGDPTLFIPQDSAITSILSFLDTHKYPPSLQYLLMTLGPGLVLLAQLEKMTDKARLYPTLTWLKVFGAVPLFFYLIHVPIINGCAQLYTWLKYGEPINMFFDSSKLPPDYEASLILTVAVWLILLIALYVPCKRYAQLKRSSKSVLLSYL